jgi:hypothetical protein
LVFVLSLGSAAHAQQVTPAEASPEAPLDAHALVDQGIALRREGRDPEAVVLFLQAFALEATPRTEAQLGLGLLATGEFVGAYEHLQHALTSRDAWIERNRAALQSSLEAASQHVGLLEVAGDEGATVTVNGESVGRLPLSGPLHPRIGRAVIEFTAEGFRSFSADVTIQAGQTSRVSVHLVPNLGPDVTQQEWFWPLILGTAGALVIAGITVGIAAAVWNPLYEASDYPPAITTLRITP